MTLKPGDIAIDFDCNFLRREEDTRSENGEGAEFTVGSWRLSEALADGPVFLIFAKLGCPTCRYTLPFIDRIYLNYPGSNVSTVVLAQEGRRGARKMIRDGDLHLMVGLDSSPHSTGETYEVVYVPTFFYVSRDGTIENVIESFAREELREINSKIAADLGVPALPFCLPEEGVPAFRPG